MNYLAHLNRSLRLKFQPYLIHEATDNEEWFCGRDVCMFLGFKNINDTLLKRVKQSHKTDLKSLVELTCVDHANSTSYHEVKTLHFWAWIVSAGTCNCVARRLFPSRVIFSSRLETANEFRSWVFEEVLPVICGAGKLEASLRQELVLKDRAVDEWNKWTTLHMM